MLKWTTEMDALLTQLWGEGLTSAKISERFPGASRNSIIGRVSRLGLPRRVTGRPEGSVASKPRKTPQIKPRAVIIDLVAHMKPTDDPTLWVPFMVAGNTTCRSIMGQGEDGLVTFCPNPKDSDESYCPYHRGIYYTPPRKSS